MNSIELCEYYEEWTPTIGNHDFRQCESNRQRCLYREAEYHAQETARIAAKNATSARHGNCPKCNGTGYIAVYAHVQAGQCFMCKGTGNHK